MMATSVHSRLESANLVPPIARYTAYVTKHDACRHADGHLDSACHAHGDADIRRLEGVARGLEQLLHDRSERKGGEVFQRAHDDHHAHEQPDEQWTVCRKRSE